MLKNFYWIIAITVMLFALFCQMYLLVKSIESEKEFKELRKKQMEYYKQLESEDK